MLLSQITDKSIRSGKNVRGVCIGVGISVKSRAVKYLLCASAPLPLNCEEGVGFSMLESQFAVGVHSIKNLCDNEITLSCLRMSVPKNHGKLFIGKPVYSDEGVFLGKITDAHLQNFIVTEVKTDKNTYHSALSIAACSDALILRKEQPFPIGQRIPTPAVFNFLTDNDVLTTRSILREAMQKGQLIRFTLSLPPFNLDIPCPVKKRRFF